MANAQIKTVTSTEFAHNVSAARRVAAGGGHVIITDRGEPTLALVPIALYRRLTHTDRSLVDLLQMPEADEIEVDFEPIRIGATDVD
jgi:prevent-host-death family protein